MGNKSEPLSIQRHLRAADRGRLPAEVDVGRDGQGRQDRRGLLLLLLGAEAVRLRTDRGKRDNKTPQ